MSSRVIEQGATKRLTPGDFFGKVPKVEKKPPKGDRIKAEINSGQQRGKTNPVNAPSKPGRIPRKYRRGKATFESKASKAAYERLTAPRTKPKPVHADVAWGQMAKGEALARTLGRALPIARRLTPMGRALDLLSLLTYTLPDGMTWGDVLLPEPLPHPVPNPANGWQKAWGDCTSITPNGQTSHNNVNVDYTCLGGQVGQPGHVGNWSIGANQKYSQLRETKYSNILKAWRAKIHSQYYRTDADVAAPQVEPDFVTTTLVPSPSPFFNPFPQVDPNVMKELPSMQPHPEAQAALALDLKLAADTMAATATQVQEAIAIASETQLTVETDIDLPTTPGRPPRPKPGPPPKPAPDYKIAKPGKTVAEPPKMRGPVAMVLMAADAISEGAEIVDAAFESLPEEVQKKWYKKSRPNMPFLDTAGQYGIDGADWKLAAVLWNADKIDAKEFFKNVIANQAEDKLIGSLHKNLPKNYINAGEDGQKEYADVVNDVLIELGLKDGEHKSKTFKFFHGLKE